MDFDELTRFAVSIAFRVLGIGLLGFLAYTAAESSKWPAMKAQIASLAVCAVAALFFGGNDGTHLEKNEDYDGLRSGSHLVLDREVSKTQQNTSTAKLFLVLALASATGVHFGIKNRRAE